MKVIEAVLPLIMMSIVGDTVQSADLRPRFDVGRAAYYHVTTAVTQSVATVGEPIKMHMSMEAEVRMEVKRVRPDGGAEIEYTILYLATGGGPSQMPLKFNSLTPRDPTANPVLRKLTDVVNKPVVLNVSPKGMILGARGNDVLGKSIPPEVSSLLSVDIIREQQQAFFPGGTAPNPVKVGMTWNARVDTPMPPAGTLIESMTFTLEQVNERRRIARIGLNVEMRLDPEKGRRTPGYTLLEGTTRGWMTWDLAAGELLRSEIEQHMALRQGGPDTPPGMGLTLRHDSETITQRISARDLKFDPARE